MTHGLGVFLASESAPLPPPAPPRISRGPLKWPSALGYNPARISKFASGGELTYCVTNGSSVFKAVAPLEAVYGAPVRAQHAIHRDFRNP